jgi:hypothetical protein
MSLSNLIYKTISEADDEMWKNIHINIAMH